MNVGVTVWCRYSVETASTPRIRAKTVAMPYPVV